MRLGAVAGLLAAGAAMPAAAAPSQYDLDFVSAFAEACVPGRLGYQSTIDTALTQGWARVERTANPELDAMMAISEREASSPDLDSTFQHALYSKAIQGQAHYLMVSRVSVNVGSEDEPNVRNVIGCYLYNLDATAPIDPEPVTALIGKPIASSHSDETLVGYTWGPPCPMPRTLDTYLTFLPEGSEFSDQAGFSGLVLKFETSEPDPGEDVPSTYC
jgi:hypothetical protein